MEYLIDKVENYSDEFYDQYKFYYPLSKKGLALKQSLLARYLLEKLLQKEAGTLKFTYTRNGKPTLKNIYFNISHSNSYVLVAISKREIGVDIERIHSIPISILKYFATKAEQNYLLYDQASFLEKTFELYTRKEAYLKMQGLTIEKILTINLTTTNVKLTTKKIENYILSISQKK